MNTKPYITLSLILGLCFMFNLPNIGYSKTLEGWSRSTEFNSEREMVEAMLDFYPRANPNGKEEALYLLMVAQPEDVRPMLKDLGRDIDEEGSSGSTFLYGSIHEARSSEELRGYVPPPGWAVFLLQIDVASRDITGVFSLDGRLLVNTKGDAYQVMDNNW